MSSNGGFDRPPDWSGDDVLDSQAAQTVREALAREAAGVKPAGDGLARIQARTRHTSARARRNWLLPVAAAAASAAVVGGVGWAVLDRDPGTPAAAVGPTSSAIPTGPAPSASAEGTRLAIPVYYVAAQPGDGGPEYRLFREFHPTSAATVPDRVVRVGIALDEMFANTPLDPDYRATLWPASTQVGSVTLDDETDIITVDLLGTNPTGGAVPDLDEDLGAATVQELVFTVTAAASYDGYQAAGVRILLDGDAGTAIFGVDVSEPLQRETAPYRAAIWILSVDDGATITNPLTVSGQARLTASGSGRWTVTEDGAPVANGVFDTQKCCAYEDFSFEVPDTLAPGNYLLTVFDGAVGDAGSAPYDSKSFIVEGPN